MSISPPFTNHISKPYIKNSIFIVHIHSYFSFSLPAPFPVWFPWFSGLTIYYVSFFVTYKNLLFFFKLSRLHTQCRLWTLRSGVAYSISGAREMPAKFAFYFGDMCSCLLFLQHCKLINYLKGVVISCLFSLSFKTLSRICACFPEYCKRSLLIWHKQWSSRKNWVKLDDFEPETLEE